MKYVNKHERVCWGFQVSFIFLTAAEVYFISLKLKVKLKVNVQTDELIPDQIINVEQRFPERPTFSWRRHLTGNTHTSTRQHINT